MLKYFSNIKFLPTVNLAFGTVALHHKYNGVHLGVLYPEGYQVTLHVRWSRLMTPMTLTEEIYY